MWRSDFALQRATTVFQKTYMKTQTSNLKSYRDTMSTKRMFDSVQVAAICSI
jgi:hypothetical protein